MEQTATHPTLDRDSQLDSGPASGERGRGLLASKLSVDRGFWVGCIAGGLISAALAVPVAYALFRLSPDIPAQQAVEHPAGFGQLIDSGLKALRGGNPELALDIFRAAEALFPAKAIVHNDVCVALNELHRYEEAVTACEAALALEPSLHLAKNNLAWARSQLSK